MAEIIQSNEQADRVLGSRPKRKRKPWGDHWFIDFCFWLALHDSNRRQPGIFWYAYRRVEIEDVIQTQRAGQTALARAVTLDIGGRFLIRSQRTTTRTAMKANVPNTALV